jgi:hypothetical protein
MKKELTREQMIALIASDYGYDEETTNKLKTEVLRDVCNSAQSYLYLKNLLDLGSTDIYLVE